MNYFTALVAVLGIASAVISIYEFIKKGFSRPGIAFSVAAVILIVAALVVANLPALTGSQTSNASSLHNPPNSQPVASYTPTQVQSAPTQNPSSVPFPTTPSPSITVGQTLYQADSTWSGWNGTKDWKVNDGLLLNDGTYADYNAGATILAPLQSPTADYSVDLQMQVVSAFTTGTIYPCFYITIRGMDLTNGWQGYAAVVCANLGHGPAIQIVAIDSSNNVFDVLSTTPFDPQNAWHNYRVEAKGTSIKFFVDGGQLLSADDSRYLGAGQIGFLSEYMQVKISSYIITAI